ncbi:MAG: IclR family transcriptional regulator [Desulfarculus sp.]|nr:IclR family transcriptional regulator [Desulfarculus sp.]
MPVSTAYRAPSVGRALKILEMVAESHGGLGISDLARMLGISKGTVFGLCQQLEDHGALTRDPVSKRYGLGPLVATLAGRGFVHARLRDLAGPELTRLRDELKESVFLGVLGRGEVTVVDDRQPPGVIRIAAGPGTRLPLTAGAVGKVFLASLPPARLEQVMAQGLKAHTPHTITDPQAFRQQVEQVRRQGYALESDEYLVGVWGVAVPLGAQAGLPAALWSVGFTSALAPGRLEKIAASLRQAAQRLAQALNGPGLAG